MSVDFVSVSFQSKSRKKVEEIHKNRMKALCKVNEFGSSSVKTTLTLGNISGSLVSHSLRYQNNACLLTLIPV